MENNNITYITETHARYIREAFRRIEETPQWEDFNIGMAYVQADWGYLTPEEHKAIGWFMWRKGDEIRKALDLPEAECIARLMALSEELKQEDLENAAKG